MVGHAVNLASRMESFTVGGQMLTSESTRQVVADQFEVIRPMEAFAKGLEATIHLWEVRGVRNQSLSMLLFSTAPRFFNPAGEQLHCYHCRVSGPTRPCADGG